MLHRLAKWCTKMWENRLYFARPTSIVLWMWRERNKWRSATYIHCPFSRSSWPMGFNLTRSYVTLLYVYLSCVRSTDSLSNHWLRIVNVRMRFEWDKSEMKTEWLSERELWLVENQFLPACHIAYNLPFTNYWCDTTKQQSQFAQTVIQSIYISTKASMFHFWSPDNAIKSNCINSHKIKYTVQLIITSKFKLNYIRFKFRWYVCAHRRTRVINDLTSKWILYVQ